MIRIPPPKAFNLKLTRAKQVANALRQNHLKIQTSLFQEEEQTNDSVEDLMISQIRMFKKNKLIKMIVQIVARLKRGTGLQKFNASV